MQLHQQKGMISLSPPTICNSAGPSTWSISAGWSAISASRRGPALRPKPASNRTLVIRRRQVEAYPNLMSDAMCKLRQDRIEF
ncbi:putative insertion sequence [Acinetobacter baumannii 1146103]|uniref:Insertion sequence n=1 Tax=Salmonella schwarzengrund (strain CVM19633) TaxID=439843 RepID=A0A0N1TUH1_SALSV|nr:insertion sequence [Salmonella enterica subsp. enterica serovar Schwarzengrund str. CVM19633]KCX59997.1 putative insertion sequence [Acinetobacter baumannii 1146103]